MSRVPNWLLVDTLSAAEAEREIDEYEFVSDEQIEFKPGRLIYATFVDRLAAEPSTPEAQLHIAIERKREQLRLKGKLPTWSADEARREVAAQWQQEREMLVARHRRAVLEETRRETLAAHRRDPAVRARIEAFERSEQTRKQADERRRLEERRYGIAPGEKPEYWAARRYFAPRYHVDNLQALERQRAAEREKTERFFTEMHEHWQRQWVKPKTTLARLRELEQVIL